VSRRNENTLDLLVKAPWWVGVTLAVIVYAVSAFELAKITLASPMPFGLSTGIGRLGPAVSLLCLLAAGVSAFHRFRRSKLLEQQTGGESIGELSWQRFEALVGEVFRRKDYAVEENLDDGPDGGVDLRLRKGGKTVFVQCKHWKAHSVGVKVVRELFGVMTAANANDGVVVTYGGFTPDARAFAKANSIALVGGSKLMQMIASVQQSGNMQPGPVPAAQPCPKCGSPMVLREARKGPHAGEKFYGCSKYPGCKGVISQVG
jgi:restriction system protein